MSKFSKSCAQLLLAGLALTSVTVTAVAQNKYPSKPIQVVVPYPPGGSDVLARKLVIGMGERLGQPFIVLNKPGASTQIATALVAAAQPDGHMLYVASIADLAWGPSLFKSLPFNALTDLTPISYIAEAPYLLTGAAASPHKSVADILALSKTNPDKAKVASYGVQSNNDILARRLNLAAGTNLPIIAYQGGAPAFNAIMRDEVQLLFPTTVASRQFIVSGQIRPLAVTTETRIPLYPDIPTFKELGFDLIDAANFGLMGPKGLPAEVVRQIHAALVAEVAKPETRAFMNDLGLVTVAGTPDDLAKRLQEMTAQSAAIADKLALEKQ